MSVVGSSDLLREKSLLEVYRLGRRVPRKPAYKVIEATTAVALLLWALTSDLTASELAQRAREWGELGFGFATAILGFLLAGFAIFTAMMRMDLALMMAQHVHERSGLSYLKYNLAVFVQVFAEYLAFVAAFVLLALFCSPGGLVPAVIAELPRYSEEVRFGSAAGAVVGIGWFLVHLVIRLQAFVFNVYHVVMTIIAWEAVKQEKPGYE